VTLWLRMFSWVVLHVPIKSSVLALAKAFTFKRASTVDQAKGVRPLLIWAAGCVIGGWGRPHAPDGGARPTRGGARAGPRRGFAGERELELGFTVLDGVWPYAKLGRRENFSGG
jgi:hypothetical protein